MGDAKLYQFEDVSKHNTLQDCWLIIEGKVYDVTRFLEDHPGGDEVLISSTGQDATDDFADVGHSPSARAMMEEYYIGEIDPSTLPFKPNLPKQAPYKLEKSFKSTFNIYQILVPLAILIFALAIGFYAKSS